MYSFEFCNDFEYSLPKWRQITDNFSSWSKENTIIINCFHEKKFQQCIFSCLVMFQSLIPDHIFLMWTEFWFYTIDALKEFHWSQYFYSKFKGSDSVWLKSIERTIWWYYFSRKGNKPQACYYLITQFHWQVERLKRQLRNVEDFIFRGKGFISSFERTSPCHFLKAKKESKICPLSQDAWQENFFSISSNLKKADFFPVVSPPRAIAQYHLKILMVILSLIIMISLWSFLKINNFNLSVPPSSTAYLDIMS